MRKYYLGILIINVVVLICVVAGFVIGGTPIDLKGIGYDTARISSFSDIKYSIQRYYKTNSRLPNSLTEIDLLSENIKDPKTQDIFTYAQESSSSYKLCTEFSTDSMEVKSKYTKGYYAPNNYGSFPNDNNHKKGFDCITYTVNASK